MPMNITNKYTFYDILTYQKTKGELKQISSGE